jgi:hypothetical protein
LEEKLMKRIGIGLAAALLASTIGIGSASAKPGGCLKYGAAGAVGGHFVHHHAVLGAMGGCAVGMYRRHKYNKAERAHTREERQMQREQRSGGAYSASHD